MKWMVLLLALAVAMAGCAESDPEPPAQGDNLDVDDSEPPMPPMDNDTEDPEPVELETRTVIDQEYSIEPNFCVTATSDEIDTVDVPMGATDLRMSFTMMEQPPPMFNPNLVVYGPGQEVGGGEEADRSSWDSSGAEFAFENPDDGSWVMTLSHCDIPSNPHRIHVTVTLTAPVES